MDKLLARAHATIGGMKIETIASVEANPEDALTNRAIELDQRCKGGVCENLAHVLATA